MSIFQESFKSEIDQNFQELLQNILKEITSWKEKALEELNMHAEVTPNVNVLKNHSDIFKESDYLLFKSNSFEDNQ